MLNLVVDIVTTVRLRVNNTACSSGYVVLNSKVICELCVEGDVKRSGHGIIWGQYPELG